MKLKYLLLAMFSLFTMAFSGCGESGSSGLNGGITVEAEADGRVVTATATYNHPTETNLIGVPINFSLRVGNQSFSLGTERTNNSGSVAIFFDAPAFNGTQTITVTASTGNLADSDSIQMTGSSLAVTAPSVTLTATPSQATGTAVPFTIPSVLLTVAGPFSTDLGGRPLAVAATFVPSNPADTLILDSPTTVTTDVSGAAQYSGANGTLIVPAVGGNSTMTITWKVTDQITGFTGTGITKVTLTKPL